MSHYSITTLDVACVTTFPADFYFDGLYRSGEFMYNVFSMTLLRGEGRNILIDSGFDLENEGKRAGLAAAGASLAASPAEALAPLGLTPGDIDAVILTHMHFDHSGGIDCYPNAMFYIQRDELEGWRRVTSEKKHAAVHMLSTDASDIARLDELAASGRLTLLKGDVDGLFPGIDIRVSRMGHSFAVSVVLIRNEKLYIHVGDVCNRPENLLGCEEFPGYMPNVKFAVGSVLNTVAFYDKLLDWAQNDISRIVMSHDGTRRYRYPTVDGANGHGIYTICD